MNHFIEKIRTVFDRMKCKHPEDCLETIFIRDDKGAIVAFMEPIVKEFRQFTPGLPELLSRWRIENPIISTASFEVTTERTTKWLDDHIIGRPDRLLFMIYDLQRKPLGHIGLSNFDFNDESGQFDSVLRGVRNEIPGLMSLASKVLIQWVAKNLPVRRLGLFVYSDNARAIHFYERLGFRVEKEIPLLKVLYADEEKLEVAPANYQGRADRYYSVMYFQGDLHVHTR